MTQKTERERLKEDLISKGIAIHDLARRGDPNAAREAHELFKVAHQLDPDDASVAGYYGSTFTLLGRDAIDPNVKVQNALKGLKLLDQAAKAEPDNIAVRLLRAYVNSRVPEHYFNRTAQAIQDFTYLAKRYEEDPGVLPRSSYLELLYHLGKAHQTLEEVEEAQSVWEKLIKANPGPRWLRLLRAEGVDVGEFHEDAESAKRRAQLVQEGAALHDRGVEGEKTAAEQALTLFEDAVEEYPDDPMLKAYYGSSVSLVGRYAEDANAPFAAAIKGIKIVDEAVKMAPGDVRVRLVRAKHCMRLPELFFRRTAVAIVDLEFVRERAEQSDLSKEEWLEVLWMLGCAYLRLGIVEDAKATWNALLEEDPDGPYKAMIDAELAPASVDVQMNEVDLDDKEAVLREGIRLHDLAVKGSREAASKALELIQRAYELDADDPTVRAYYGSAIALSVRDGADTSATFSNVIQGMIHLNIAVKLDPTNETARLLRAYLCFRLPETMFHLTKVAIEDFEFLRDAYRAKSDGAVHASFVRVLKDLASAYSRVGRDDEAQLIRKELEGIEHGVI